MKEKKISKTSEKSTDNTFTSEKDVLGMPKQSQTNTKGYTTLKSFPSWRILLLVALGAIGLYLIYFSNKKTDPIDINPSNYNKIEAPEN